jgi:hypothetical protein
LIAVFILTTFGKSNKSIMSKEKGVYTGIIEKDENGNYFCGEYLLDYKYTEASFKLGDEINIKTVIANPSDKSYNQYPKKSRNFFLANQKE